jgi:short-subunit dehydrogenase
VGHVDVLVNNAGIDYKDRVENTPLSIYQRVMDVNYHGNITLTLALLPWLADGGQVVVISSVNALLSDKSSSAYSAAKRALHGFYDALRAEQPRLTVSVVVPGYVRTPITMNSINGSGRQFGALSEASLAAMPADTFAARAVRALERGQTLVVIAGVRERFAVRLHSVFPRLFYRLAAHTAPEYENSRR